MFFDVNDYLAVSSLFSCAAQENLGSHATSESRILPQLTSSNTQCHDHLVTGSVFTHFRDFNFRVSISVLFVQVKATLGERNAFSQSLLRASDFTAGIISVHIIISEIQQPSRDKIDHMKMLFNSFHFNAWSLNKVSSKTRLECSIIT